MQTFRQACKMLRYNLASVIFFEITYRIIGVAAFLPILYALLSHSLNLAGISYLASGTVNRYLRAPSTYAFFVVMLLIVAMFILVNLCGMIYAMEASVRQEKINPLEILIHGLGEAFRGLLPKNLGTIVYVLFVLPFTYSLTLSGSLFGLKLPEFLIRFFDKHIFGIMGALAIYLVLCVTFFRKMFMLNYFVLYDVDYKQACRMSRMSLKHHAWKILLGIVIFNLLLALLIVLLDGALSTGIAQIVTLLFGETVVATVVDTVMRICTVLLYIMIAMIVTPLVHAYICAHFYEREGDLEYEDFKKMHYDKMEEREKKITLGQAKKRQRVFFASIVALGLILNGCYVYLSVNNYVSFRIAYPTNASVTAHRGDAGNAPENTMPAFEKAVEAGADIIELDVRQTRDGVYIIMHDENLKRTADVRQNVGEVDYEYIQKLDVGSTFSKEYDGTPVPTLEEVLQFAIENDVTLNIELKTADTDKNYVEGLIALLQQYDYVGHCMLGSQSLKALRRAKELEPDIQTLYIMTMAFGTFGNMEGIDAFSIKRTYINNNMVNDIHAHGKKVYAWTVNKEADIKNLLLLDVDGIITDEPEAARKVIETANDSILEDLLKRFIYQ